MMQFGEMMDLLSEVKEKFPTLTWDVNSNGVLVIKAETYVGIENHDLTKQARQMFEPSEW